LFYEKNGAKLARIMVSNYTVKLV